MPLYNCYRFADLWKAICYLNDTKLLEFVLTVGPLTACLIAYVIHHIITYYIILLNFISGLHHHPSRRGPRVR